MPLTTGQDDDELFAAETRDGVHRAYTNTQRPRDRLQNLVAGWMTMRVVDDLEMVDVKHQQQCGLARARDHFDLALQYVLEIAAVGQTGERVLQGQLTQLVDQGL